MRHEQRDRDEKHDHVRDERLAVGDGGRRSGADGVGRAGGLARLERLAEAQPEENQHEHKADADDDAGVFNEVREGIAERGADDDVGGIAAHGGGAAEVGAEDLRQDHRNGVKAQDLRQLQRDGREKQHDRDAVDEHGQKRGHGHEAQQQRHDVVVRELCQRQAQPTEEAGFAEALDHDHHTGDEEDGRPVDAGACALRSAVPEVGAEDRTEVQSIFDRVPAVHADAEHDHEHEGCTAKGDILALEFVHDDERKHADEDDSRKDLSSHGKTFFLEICGECRRRGIEERGLLRGGVLPQQERNFSALESKSQGLFANLNGFLSDFSMLDITGIYRR